LCYCTTATCGAGMLDAAAAVAAATNPTSPTNGSSGGGGGSLSWPWLLALLAAVAALRPRRGL
jgi:serine protease